MKNTTLIYDADTKTEMLVISKEEYEALLSENKNLKEKLSIVEFELAELKRMIYGSKSERFISPDDQSQLSFFEVPPLTITVPEKEEIQYTREKTKDKKKPVRMVLPAHFPRIIHIIEPEGVDLSNAIRIGEAITEILDYKPGVVQVIQYLRPKYLVPEKTKESGIEENEEGCNIVIADLPTFVIHKGNASAALLAYILISKFVDHLPYYRQIQMFKRLGIDIPSSTIDDWQTYVCDKLLLPLYLKLVEVFLRTDYIMADETRIDVLDKKKGKNIKNKHQGYHWFYYDPINKLVCIDYCPGRGMEGPLKFLKNFSGTVQTDGYEVYESCEKQLNITLLGCNDHSRRYFEKALKNDPERAKYGLMMYQKLYMIEREAKELYGDLEQPLFFEKRKALRNEKAVPVLNEMEQWLKDNISLVAPKTPIGKAITYTFKRWNKLIRYVEDGKYEIGNNLIENSIRPIAIGRNNYMHAGSDAGAKRGAIVYSFVSICKLHGINPQEWLEDVLNKLPDTKQSELEQLLPQNWKKARDMKAAEAMQNVK